MGVLRVLFVPGQGRLLSLTSDNTLHLWQLDGSQLARKQSVQLEGRLKTVSSLCLEQSRKRLLVGTEGGNIYQLQLWNFQWDEEIIYQVRQEIEAGECRLDLSGSPHADCAGQLQAQPRGGRVHPGETG